MTIIEKYTTVGTFEYSLPNKKFVNLICHPEVQNTPIYAMDESSYLWAWGTGTNGELGNNINTSSSFPTSVVGDKKWIKVVCGTNSIVGLDQSSYAWAWGLNSSGQLGDGTITNRSSPVSVIGDRQFIDIMSNTTCFFALDSSSYLWSWGLNTNGNLGDGTVTNRSSPISVLGDKTWRKFPLDFYGSSFLDSSSYVWSWGLNSLGQLGDNTITNRSSPVSVVGGRQWTRLMGSRGISGEFAMDSSSFIWGWGSGSYIGDGNTVNRSSPVSVLGQNNFNFIKMIVGNLTSYTLGVDTSSRVWHWGPAVNAITYSSPVLYGDLQSRVKPDFVKISFDNTARWVTAITENNDIFSWGSNQYGQAGIGFTGALSAFPFKALTTASFTNLIVPYLSGAAAVNIALDSSSYIYTWGTSSAYIGESGTTFKYSPTIMRSTVIRKNILGE